MTDLRHTLVPLIPQGVFALREAFSARGRDIRVVGGAVRDSLLGDAPKDIDLCTDADPDEQREVYERAGLRHFPTGLAHGTWTVELGGGEMVEVTSLRVDLETDGRHAEVGWTRDWETDLGRRDLTINAMAMDLDGTLHDPFGGRDDLLAGRVRFVGSAAERIREDYLRILRWLRFEGRYGVPLSQGQPDGEAVSAVAGLREGLRRVSRERVWSELRRIAAHPRRPNEAMHLFSVLGLAGPSGIPEFDAGRFSRFRRLTSDPAVLFALSCPDPEALAAEWRWSRADRERALFVQARIGGDPPSLPAARRMVADAGERPDHVVALLRAFGREEDAREMEAWSAPAFPAVARVLKARGMEPGPAMGAAVARLRAAWAEGGYSMGAEELADLELPARPAPM